MRMKIRSTMLIGLSCLLVSISSIAKEPANLALAKQTVIQYHDSGEYDKDISHVIDRAMAYLKARVNSPKTLGKKPAIVLDIDETSLSNYPDMKRLDFGGTIEEIRADEDKAVDDPITPTLKLYQYANEHHIAVIFLTGRFEDERSVTEKNLESAGYKNWDKLILRDSEYKNVAASTYKTAMRKKLTAEGYNIILNIGDQQSDLAGGYADKTYKLPNPYYFIK